VRLKRLIGGIHEERWKEVPLSLRTNLLSNWGLFLPDKPIGCNLETLADIGEWDQHLERQGYLSLFLIIVNDLSFDGALTK
jgi:hypothetical protein